MSLISSSPAALQLNWVKSGMKGRQDLVADGSILGSLQRVGFWKSTSRAEFKGQAWSFQRSGCAGTHIFEEPGSRHVGSFKANWLGGGTLLFNDGQRFQLVTKGFWRPIWFWLNDQERDLFEVVPHKKTVRIIDSVVTSNWDFGQSRLPVLILFSWHQILKTQDDAAAAAMIGAVSAG